MTRAILHILPIRSFIFNVFRLALGLHLVRAQAIEQLESGDAMTAFNLSKLAMAAAMAVLAGQAVAQSAVNPRQPALRLQWQSA